MDNKIDFEAISMSIILKAGEAKSLMFEAIDLAKAKKLPKAKANLTKAEQLLGKAGQEHMDIIVKEAAGKEIKFSVLFMHAEDQFLSTQTTLELIKKLIDIF